MGDANNHSSLPLYSISSQQGRHATSNEHHTNYPQETSVFAGACAAHNTDKKTRYWPYSTHDPSHASSETSGVLYQTASSSSSNDGLNEPYLDSSRTWKRHWYGCRLIVLGSCTRVHLFMILPDQQEISGLNLLLVFIPATVRIYGTTSNYNLTTSAVDSQPHPPRCRGSCFHLSVHVPIAKITSHEHFSMYNILRATRQGIFFDIGCLSHLLIHKSAS